ncbi:MAG TPA: phosphodiester glycosidase family protein [Gemmatimonadales bacterium]|nr:phosphodiester glycosidase family protein [Gemmatimonadales bacterium]
MRLALRTVLATTAAGAIAGADPTPRLSVDHLPSRLDEEVAWRPGTAGIEYGELQLTGSGEAWRTRVVVARLDPGRVQLSLQPAFTRDERWTIADAGPSAALALNAGQFRGNLPWGWVVTGGRQLISPGSGPLAGAVMVDGSGAVRIVPPDEVIAEQRRGQAREAFQSYPMLLEDGAVPEALVRPGLGVTVRHRDARLALGTLPDGRVVVALTRFDALGPRLGGVPFGFTSAEMARVMRALGCRDAILLDGGVSGQLLLREVGGAVRTWAGVRSVPLGLVARSR